MNVIEPSVESPDELTAPIYDAIALAEDAHVLLRLDQVSIPHCKGITDDQRAALKRAVREKFQQISNEKTARAQSL